MTRVLLFGSTQVSGRIVYNFLKSRLNVVGAVLEDRPSRIGMAKRRAARLGLKTVFGQVAFILTVPRLLRRVSEQRVEEIRDAFDLDFTPIPKNATWQVDSINSDHVLDVVCEVRPDVIVVCGTRIISRRVIEHAACPMINIHVGITPKYRGIHGGYWALFNRDRENFGTTIHLIDEGIDTGTVLRQVRVVPSKEDNFATYPLLQLAHALEPLYEEILRCSEDNSAPIQPDAQGVSDLYYHPTLLQYLKGRVKGVK